ncbi:MAG TPA: ABC transporter ATP-binding protein [Candidatus Nanopelagicaceae bacterium]|nr:ABC transporter ATP-binding protein [Candidatus Nanopelagicaceae bacterium]
MHYTGGRGAGHSPSSFSSAGDPSQITPRAKGTVRRVVKLFRPYRLKVFGILGILMVVAMLGIVNPYMLKLIIDDAILKHDPRLLLIFFGIMVITPVVSTGLGVWQTYLNAVVGQRMMQDLRVALYTHLQNLPLRFFTATRTGEIQSRLANDVGGVDSVITNTATSTVSNLTRTAATLAGMAFLSWQLTLLSVAVLPIFILVTVRVGEVRRRVSAQTQVTLADLSALAEETLSVSGILLTKVYGREQRARDRYVGETARLTTLMIRQQMVGRWFFGFIQTFFSILPAGVYLMAGLVLHAGVKGGVSVGTLVSFTTFQSALFFPIGQLLNIQVEMQGALALFDRIFQYLDIPVEIEDRPGAITIPTPDIRGRIGFENVTFSYEPGATPAVKGVSFDAEPGQLVALVGPSGAGKSTLTYLMARLYDVDRGKITLDGHDLRDLTTATLRAAIAVVTQETFIFHSTIRENLLVGRPDASDEEMIAAGKAAAIHDRIMELPNGYDTVGGERGYRLSGGEKQRVALARAILKNPRILILDEATSALDSHSERAIQDAIALLMEGRTTIAIAHRLSTILAADLIVMMEHGQIVERGTHTQLMAQGGPYSRLYLEQFARQPMEPASQLER